MFLEKAHSLRSFRCCGMVLQKSIHLLASIRSDIWLEQFLLLCISGLDLKTGDEGLLRAMCVTGNSNLCII